MPEFDDPFKSSDSTVIRPRPGAGRRAPSDAGPIHRPAPAAAAGEPLSAAALESVGLGLGPLVRAASPLLLLAGQLRGTLSGPDVQTLRRHALDEIRRFEDRARSLGIQNETVLAARYALCAALDEAVLSTPWGAQSEWTQQSLLIAMHREAFGGEKFFEMLDRIMRDPKHHIDLMEVQYACLAMGFAGKYQVASRGQAQLLDIQHDLYKRIREYPAAPPAELSPRWKVIEDRRNRLIKYVPWWVVGAVVFGAVVIAFALFRTWLGPQSEAVRKILNQIPAAEAPVQVAGLADHLRAEIASGLLEVKDGSKVVLTNIFASGSDRIDVARAGVALDAVCRALNNFPDNRIQVRGHTDDLQPKGLYGGNQELSDRRAENVAERLRGCLQTNKNRVSSRGMADAELLPPQPDGSHRAKSRRVEIILLGES